MSHHILLIPSDALPSVRTAHMHRRTHFEDPAVDTGIRHTLRISQLADGQMGGNDQWQIGLVPFIHDCIHLLLGILGAALDAKIIDDQQRLVIEGSNILITLLRIHRPHLIQDLGKVRHQDRR